METFTKRVRVPDQAGYEAAGLRWLADAAPAYVAPVVRVSGTELTIGRVREVPPTPAAAREFGAALRQVHDAGAPAFGCPPSGWEGLTYIGRIEQPCEPRADWGGFYAGQRVLTFAAATPLPRDVRADVDRACTLIADYPWEVQPARIHGDLWAGNVLFGESGVVMIDPAAHGGHPHTDLGMLALFGVPYFEEILAGYGAPADIESWLPLYQLHPLAVHALTHGPAYYGPLGKAARATIRLLER